MISQADKATSFKVLHVPGTPFVIANVWDVGSARMLAALGAKALATTSSGYAFSFGFPDGGNISRDAMLSHCADIVAATPLPVSADLENGYGEAPEFVAETVKLAAEIGLVGCTIEDIKLPHASAYEFDLAVERIRAAAEVVRGLDFSFMLTARADGILTRAYDAAEAVKRLGAFSEAGADVLYAPMLPLAETATVAKASGTPVNALAAGPFAEVSLEDFAKVGVARISIGGGLSRLAYTVAANSARAMLEKGDFSDLTRAMSSRDAEGLLAAGAGE